MTSAMTLLDLYRDALEKYYGAVGYNEKLHGEAIKSRLALEERLQELERKAEAYDLIVEKKK